MDSKIIKEKSEFVEKLRTLVMSDCRTSVKELHYVIISAGSSYQEYIYIAYRGGHIVKVTVTGNSLGAITKAVIDEVYR